MKTVLVLGAGASIAAGFPTGAQLRQSIIQFGNPASVEIVRSIGLATIISGLQEFAMQFKQSQMWSIDAFLARRPEFAEIGKRCIAAALLKCESDDHLFSMKHDDLWYPYLFNKISTETWETLTFESIGIITFNYDRSLEYYLSQAIQSAYGRSETEAAEKLKLLEIVHVYGTLGETLPGNPQYIQYGEGTTDEGITAAARGLRVIPEGRQNDPTLTRAREILRSARHIAFMGFGFDALNLERLDASNSCSEYIKTPNGNLPRRRVATCYGLTQAEARAAAAAIGVHRGEHALPPDFFDTNCYRMLRGSLILDAQ